LYINKQSKSILAWRFIIVYKGWKNIYRQYNMVRITTHGCRNENIIWDQVTASKVMEFINTQYIMEIKDWEKMSPISSHKHEPLGYSILDLTNKYMQCTLYASKTLHEKQNGEYAKLKLIDY
jgi:hypothetical protein